MYWTWHGHKFKSEQLKKIKHRIIRVERRGASENQICWLRCGRYGCENEVRFRDALHSDWDICRPCSARKIFGHKVRSEALWENRAWVVDIIKTRKPSGSIYLCYVVRCVNTGCTNTYRTSKIAKIGNDPCKDCMCRKNAEGREFHMHFWHLKRDAENRGLGVALDFAAFQKLCRMMTCFYCRKDFHRTVWNRKYAPKSWASRLDRMDNEQGYTQDNVVPCCYPCNKGKRATFTAKEWLVLQAMRRNDAVAALTWVQSTDDDVIVAAQNFKASLLSAYTISSLTPYPPTEKAL